MKIRSIHTLTILSTLLFSPFVQAEDTIVTIEVRAGDHLRQHTPVFLQLPSEVLNDRRLVMQRVEDRTRIGIQKFESIFFNFLQIIKGRRLLWLLLLFWLLFIYRQVQEISFCWLWLF